MKSKKIKPFDIHTNAEWRKLGLTAENRPKVSIEPSEVPEQFQCLIPYAERWAIRCDVTRSDYFEKQPKEDIRHFFRAIEPYGDAVEKWIFSFGEASDWPEAAVHFLYMLKAQAEAFYELPSSEQEEILRTRELKKS
jgi:hypothetical protein